jgi:hypothetical protein
MPDPTGRTMSKWSNFSHLQQQLQLKSKYRQLANDLISTARVPNIVPLLSQLNDNHKNTNPNYRRQMLADNIVQFGLWMRTTASSPSTTTRVDTGGIVDADVHMLTQTSLHRVVSVCESDF